MQNIKCWDCAYLGTCLDCNEEGCKDFVHYKMTFGQIAELCKVSERTVYRWFETSEIKALNTIYHRTGYRFKLCNDVGRGRRCLVRKLNRR